MKYYIFSLLSILVILLLVTLKEDANQSTANALPSFKLQTYQRPIIYFLFKKETLTASIYTKNATINDVLLKVSKDVGFNLIYDKNLDSLKATTINIDMKDISIDAIIAELVLHQPYKLMKKNEKIFLCIGQLACKEEPVTQHLPEHSDNNDNPENTYSMISEVPIIIDSPGSNDSDHVDTESLKSQFSSFSKQDKIKILSLLKPDAYAHDLDFILNIMKYDVNEKVRQEAVEKLAFIENEKTKEALMGALSDQDEKVVIAALNRLYRFKHVDKEQIKSQLQYTKSAAIKFELNYLNFN